MAFPLFIFLVRDHQLRYTHTHTHHMNQIKPNQTFVGKVQIQKFNFTLCFSCRRCVQCIRSAGHDLYGTTANA